MNKISVLRGIVCGFEHGGTTLVAQLLRQHPEIDTGFEVGALLHDSPQAFLADNNPWAKENGLLWEGWGIAPENVSDCETFEEFYCALQCHSPYVRNKGGFLIDKTPRYQLHLVDILSRFDVPAIVMIKDPVLLWYSWWKRGHALENCIGSYLARMQATKEAIINHEGRVMVVYYEGFVRQPEASLQKMFRHFGFDAPAYTGEFESDWVQVQGNTIVDDVVERLVQVPRDDWMKIRNVLGRYCYLDS